MDSNHLQLGRMLVQGSHHPNFKLGLPRAPGVAQPYQSAYPLMPMTLWERRNARYWYAAAMAAFALLFFARSFSSYFVCDDFQFLDRINFSNAAEYLTKSWGYGNEYRPFLPYTYAWDAYFSGANPVGYHLTNTLLHTASSVIIAGLAVLLGLSRRTAALAG